MTKLRIQLSDDLSRIKFVTDKNLTDKTHVFRNLEEADISPLARQLFKLPFVKSVEIGPDFIGLEKHDMLQWSEVQEDLREILLAYLLQNKPLFADPDESPVEVYAESTPNPETQKFVVNRFLTNRFIEVSSVEEASEIPLAFELFEYPFVKKVFISQNYISITKDASLEWFEVTEPIRDFLKEYIGSRKNIISKNYEPDLEDASGDAVSKQIISLIDEYIRPAVAGDGGNIRFDSYDPKTRVVNIELQGACSGCPSAHVTMKNGVEATLKRFLGEKIDFVNAIN